MVSTDDAHNAHNDDSSSDYDSSSRGDEEQNSSNSFKGNKSVTKYTWSFKYRVSFKEQWTTEYPNGVNPILPGLLNTLQTRGGRILPPPLIRLFFILEA